MTAENNGLTSQQRDVARSTKSSAQTTVNRRRLHDQRRDRRGI